MDSNIFCSGSIAELLASMGLGKPDHPLIALIDSSKLEYDESFVGMRFTSEMYCIALKDAGCGIDYGRNHFDFTEGALLFTSPRQVFKVTKPQRKGQSQGWMLYFHPDLIRNTDLGAKIDQFTFFDYEVHEALYLSQSEQNTLTQIANLIDEEVKSRIDNHSQTLLVSNIELLLNYSKRFYERQMNTRAAQNSDIVTKVESLLKDFYRKNELIETGQPTIQYLADACNLSAGYLSDILSKETGRSAREHIQDFLINKAKNQLLNSEDSVSTIAYGLGFNYPHYFSRMFRQKTGLSPQEYRKST